MIIKRGLINTLKAIRNNKLLFLGLLFLQILFIIIISVVSYQYFIDIQTNIRGVMEPIEEGNYDPTSIEEGQLFTDDALIIYQSYRSLAKNVIKLSAWLLGLFIIFNGSLWIFSHWFFIEKKKASDFFRSILKYISTTIIFLLPYLIIGYFFLKMMLKRNISLSEVKVLIQIVLAIFLVFYFFMTTAFSLVNIRSWKHFLKRWYRVSIRKIYHSLPLFLLNLILITGSFYLMSIFIDDNTFFLMMLFSITFLIILITTRIFYIACLKEIK